MSEWVKLTASDGVELQGYVARPKAEAIGAVVVIQEIFGVNKSIRGVADWYAEHGFLAVAPALFDRIEPGVELGYDEESMKKAFSLYPKLDPGVSVKDVAAAFEFVKTQGLNASVVGFCYGGLMAWVSATRGPEHGFTPVCTVGYYAGGIGKVATEEPSCPVMLHFGTKDDHIGADQVDAVRDNHPEVLIYTYEGAGHAFANSQRSSYVAEAAHLADERSLEFIKKNLA